MLDVKDSIEKLSWDVNHHYLHVKNQHEFMRRIAIQFELAYTDFRVIQMALQLSGDENHQLLADFTSAYDDVFKFESEFAENGLDGFNDKYGDQIDEYGQAVDKLNQEIDKIKKLQ
ncbi:hypothetical protein [Lentilactobacillus sp. Marseille-Q4993]|uniref:hypothetical protein n=1 Tax=Lentilactobacillus sp. Marseille-Q4993 TaxID=3039492 RepID=UPI0024BC884D|nr:hypothetical protein [Lentilactobacillus sp. Marseille-Q4993]